MARGSDGLRRNKWRLEPRPRVLVCCEGQRTEPSYLKGLRLEQRNRLLRIEVYGRGDVPKSLVDHAVELKQQAERRARRERDANLKYDEVWCVFDVDSHPNIPEARQKAQAHGIMLAVSNPCFEIWILLHFQDRRAHIERQEAKSACRCHLPVYDKEVPYARLAPHYQQAVDRARNLDAWQVEQGRPEGNPSTGVYRLTERLEELSKAAQLKKISRS